MDPQTYINLLTLVRKVIPNDKIVSERQFLIDEIIEMAKIKVMSFNKKLNKFMPGKGQEIANINSAAEAGLS